MCKLKRFCDNKYHNTNGGCIITRLGTVYDQSGCGCVYMDAACGRRPLAQVLRNSLSGHPPLSSMTRDTITSAIYSQRREGPSRRLEEELRPRITQYLSGRVRSQAATMFTSDNLAMPILDTSHRLSSLVLCCAFCLLAHLVRSGTGYRHPVRC